MKNNLTINVEHYLDYYSMLFERPISEIKSLIVAEDERIKKETSIRLTGRECVLLVNEPAFTGDITVDLLSIVNVVGSCVLNRILEKMKTENKLPVETGAFASRFYHRFITTALSFLNAAGEKSVLFEPVCENLFNGAAYAPKKVSRESYLHSEEGLYTAVARNPHFGK